MEKRLLTSLLIFTVTCFSFGQQEKIKKANEEFESYSYIDARKIYLKVVEDGYESAQVFKKLGDTYYYNSEYQEASKWYKKLIAQFSNETEPEYYYRAAQSLKSIEEYEGAERFMNVYLDSAPNTIIAQSYSAKSDELDGMVNFLPDTYEVVNVTNDSLGLDFAPTFFNGMLVFASTSKDTYGSKIDDWSGQPFTDLFIAEIDSIGKPTNITSLPGEINTPFHESSATFTKDGNTVYFTRNNFINGKKKRGKDRVISLKIYKATKDGDGNWADVKELPFNDDYYSAAHPALSPDEKRLYFSSNMEGTLGRSDIWYVDILDNDSYGEPVNLGPKINTEARETFPYVSKNNNLYFASDGHLGLGGLDLFVISMGETKDYDQVTNLKQPINTSKDDFGFTFDEEKRTGYLSSNRDGTIGSVSDDIFLVKENCTIELKGVVFDNKTNKPIPGSVVMLLDGENKVLTQTVVGSDAKYSFKDLINCGDSYTVRGTNSEKEYEPHERMVSIPKRSISLEVDIPLTPPDCPVEDLGCRLDLQPIYFDFDKHDIRPDAEIELAKILQAMKEYPQLIIHIESHTDARGDDDYNMTLSNNRANSTLEWLVAKGIDRNRLSSKGYGESRLLNKCSNDVECTKEEHQLNRRSMFIIKN